MAAIEDAVSTALTLNGEVGTYIDTLHSDNAALTAEVAALKAAAAAQDAIAASLTAANAALQTKISGTVIVSPAPVPGAPVTNSLV